MRIRCFMLSTWKDVFYELKESETQFHSHKCNNVFTTQFQRLHLKLCLHVVFKLVPKLVSIEPAWKPYKARSAGETTPCCPPPIHSRVSEWSKSLRLWHASRFVSPISCRLSSFCWAVNCVPSTSISMPSCDGILSGTCQKVCKLCINPYISIVNPLWTDIHTNIHTYKHNLRLRSH